MLINCLCKEDDGDGDDDDYFADAGDVNLCVCVFVCLPFLFYFYCSTRRANFSDLYHTQRKMPMRIWLLCLR